VKTLLISLFVFFSVIFIGCGGKDHRKAKEVKFLKECPIVEKAFSGKFIALGTEPAGDLTVLLVRRQIDSSLFRAFFIGDVPVPGTEVSIRSVRMRTSELTGYCDFYVATKY
jgi:hypothetical protein